MFNEFQRSALGGDLIEDRGNVIYVGIFRPGTNESGTGNCMIRRIEQVKDEEKGIVTTRTTYPSGNNFDYGDTWSERDNYEYMYAKSK
ncbi:MAG: hypothetical protein IAB08_05595 [Bacteroidetes bacterium]|uniref:Uncharacterized protein n=1 Tax=Candidatus Pullibacteroides excrementavium TaxID=2840905 RepID=A0A9D9DU52_9BACT|nr:hypothetical protein [Candidatus Pullibacteroides excrementavium]